MKIVVTGASGFIGTEIVPLLAKRGVELLLVGRDESKLKELFPGIRTSVYADLSRKAANYDALLHLAVMNNDKNGTIEEFRAVNVVFLRAVLEAAGVAGIRTFITTSTLQSINKSKNTPYTQTKRESEQLFSSVKDIEITNLKLPAVYGKGFSGKLANLYYFPTMLRPFILQLLASAKPTVHISLVVKAVIEATAAGVTMERIVSNRQIGNWFYAATKRSVDLCFVFVVVLLFWWLLLLAWAVVKFTSDGPGIFVQERIGRNAKTFMCLKFRTMFADTRQAGSHEISGDKVTVVGRVLRKTKVDELPQIWNILKNELSLVGPRPCLPSQHDVLVERQKLGVFDVKCGITGWAQIQGVDMSDPKLLASLDADYIAMRSTLKDLGIIFSTATGNGLGDRTGT